MFLLGVSSWKPAGVFALGLLLSACSDSVDIESLLASTTTSTTAPFDEVPLQPTSTSTTTAPPRRDDPIIPDPPPAPVVPTIPTPIVLEVDFDAPPGASVDERRRLNALRSSTAIASVLEVGRSTGGSLSPDGTRLVVPEAGELCVIVLADAEKSCTPIGDEYAGRVAGQTDLPLVWSPDSRRVAVAVPTSIWRDAIWVFDPELSAFSSVSSEEDWNGPQIPLAWPTELDQILVMRYSSDLAESSEIVLVGADGDSVPLFVFADSAAAYRIRVGSFSFDRGLVLFGRELGAVRLTVSGLDVLTEPDERGASARAVAIADDVSAVAFVGRKPGIFQAWEGPSFIVDTETGATYELPGEPAHIMFDPTSRWVATVVEDTSTDPTTYVVSVAAISDPGAGVEVFRSNADEFFTRTDRDGRREPGASPPAPVPMWSDQDTLLIPLTQQGSILRIELVGW